MKITQKIEAGRVTSFWISYNGNWELTLEDGSQVICKVSEEVLRDIAKSLNKEVAEKDAKALEAAREKVVAELEAEAAEEMLASEGE